MKTKKVTFFPGGLGDQQQCHLRPVAGQDKAKRAGVGIHQSLAMGASSLEGQCLAASLRVSQRVYKCRLPVTTFTDQDLCYARPSQA